MNVVPKHVFAGATPTIQESGCCGRCGYRVDCQRGKVVGEGAQIVLVPERGQAEATQVHAGEHAQTAHHDEVDVVSPLVV